MSNKGVYSLFKYPIWTQQQNGSVVISTQPDLGVMSIAIPLPKSTSERDLISFRKEYFNAILKLQVKINEKIRDFSNSTLPLPKPMKVKVTLELRKEKKLTPSAIRKTLLKNSDPKNVPSVDTIRRMFDRGVLKNISKSKTHRVASLDNVLDVFIKSV